METLNVTKDNAIKAFKEANDKGKQLLKNLFGEKTFVEKITDRVKTFEDACDILGIDSDEALPYDADNADELAANAYAKLVIIARALNEGWKPNWNDSNEAKWSPYFKMGSGFGFSYSYYVCACTGSTLGSRLCFKSSALAEYAGKQFEGIYKEFLTL